MTRRISVFFIAFLAVVSAPAQTPVKSDSIVSQHATPRGVDITTEHGVLHVSILTDSLVHIEFAPGQVVKHPQPWIVETTWPPVPFTVTEDASKNTVIATKKVRITALRDSAALVFADENGNVLLREAASPRPRQLTPVNLDGENTFRADAYFDLTQDEALYGMGQRQSGLLNLRGSDLLLMQDNTNITVPLLLSSQGYGLLWNYASLGRMDNHYQPKLALRAEVADGVDYFFIFGPKFDEIVASYRALTGESPLLPKFAYGFWQSRLAYANQQEFVGTAQKYRELKIPLDVLVLDANWMTRMGAMEFTTDFPDPPGMFAKLHEMNVHPVLSEWPLYTPPSPNFDFMREHGYFITGGRTELPMYDRGTRLFDAFNPAARAAYWEQIKRSQFDIGVEGWWLDSSEPIDSWGEESGSLLENTRTALGNGSRYANAYPFFETQAAYDGQRATTDKQRVVTLTRSAFLGQQRNSAIAWSGDIYPSFDTLRRQIPAGLNYSMSGLPYWTTDIGGFLGGDPDSPAYQELYVRWFEYGTFCPIFRTHGARKANELWSYGAQAQEILTSYDRLRYRLLPYIYSTAWRVTSQGYTPMRALVMDFPLDRNALDVTDQFMFGPAMLVSPVIQAGAMTRMLYLPAGATWFDFWTGQSQRGGRTIQPNAHLEMIPVYVRAGSIVPMGPELQWTSEKAADSIELRIYPGADAEFTLYEDDGVSYAYEKGEHATIDLRWDDASSTLRIGERHGAFPGMLEKRTFNVVLVGAGKGVGGAVATVPSQQVAYDGKAQVVRLQRR